MHRSKLGGFIIDCEEADLPAAAQFWSEALGMPQMPLPGEEGQRYVRLRDEAHGLQIEVQKVAHASRVHLDIETDDVQAEVRRLEALGARRIEAKHTWVVMAAPTGQRFCVVRAQTTGFERQAKRWP